MKKIYRAFVALLLFSSTSLLAIETANAGLYAFTSHTFTACGATGRTGPTTLNCTSSYSSATWASNTSYFNTSSGIQLWTVPSTASYRITAYGARGGTTGNGTNAGGKGVRAIAELTLTQGEIISILVGQSALDNSSTQGSAGGGGGTFVVNASNTPLVVAGGGGGAAFASSTGTPTGMDANASNSGTAARDGIVAGGTSGNGAASPGNAWSGASGGGLLSDGGNLTENGALKANTGGKSFLNGGAGGLAGSNYGTVGGFGGGGGSTWGAAGGGGYSGGGGDTSDGNWVQQGGGGGGSFVSGSNTSMSPGINNSSGYVTIQILVGAPDAPTIGTATATSPTTAAITFTAPANNNGDTITAYTAISTPESRTATITQSGSGTITVTGLSPNTSYIFRVYATNGYGDSAYSAASSSITTPVATTSITISITGNASFATYGTQTTITANIVGTNGKVTFYLNSKRLPGCINRPTTSLAATCPWKPAIHGNANLSAFFTPTSNAYVTSSTSRSYPIAKRTNLR